MVSKSMTLGKYTAWLSYVLETDFDIEKIADQIDMDSFGYVKILYENSVKNNKKWDIPRVRCAADAPFLTEDDAFLVSHALIEINKKNVNQIHLIQHLNNCYDCFQIYSQFFKDFIRARKDIQSTHGKK